MKQMVNGCGAHFFLMLGLFALAASGTGCATGPSSKDTKVAQAEYDLASDAFHRGKLRAALGHVENSVELHADNADTHYLGAMILLMFCARDDTSPDCRYTRIEQYLRSALQSRPDMRDAQNALGVVLIQQERATEAIAVLKPLSEDMLYRSPEKAWGNLGWAYFQSGKIDPAVQALKRAVASQPRFCVGHYRLGLAYEKKREYVAARQALTRALSIDDAGCSRLQSAYQARARVGTKLGKMAQVRKDLKQCHELAHTTPSGMDCAQRLRRLR